MDENTIKIIKDRLDSLPQNLREMFMSAYYENTLEEISKKYQLNTDQVNFLQKETTLVIMGTTKPADFESELKKELIIDEIKISQIAREVNDKIFSKVSEFLEIINSPEYEDSKEIKISTKPEIVQNLDARFDKLPENIKEMVEKSNYQTTLYTVAQAHKLSVTQMGILDSVTTDLIIGEIHPDQFKGSLLKKLGLSEEETTTLVNEINEKVFKKIRGQLMGLSDTAPKIEETPINKPPIQTLKSDLDALKSHGIEITPEKLEITTSKTTIPTQNNNTPKEIHPLLTQKMSGSVQSQIIKSSYGPTNTLPSKNEVKTLDTTQTQKPGSYKPGTDPYRIQPE